MRLFALDVAPNSIGLAVSNEDQEFVTFSTSLQYKKKTFRKDLQAMYIKYNPELTYIGLPYNIMSDQYKFIKRFSHNFRDVLGKFQFVDESGTTILAKEYKDYYVKFNQDAKTAEIILQIELDNIYKKILDNKEKI